MRLLSAVVVSLIATLAVARADDAASRKSPANVYAVPRDVTADIFDHLRTSLKGNKSGAILLYVSSCSSNEADPHRFPQSISIPDITFGQVLVGEAPLTSVQELFKDSEGAHVAGDPSGLIRTMIGQPNTAILRTKIARIRFTSVQRYNPAMAMAALTDTKEMRSAYKRLRTRPISSLAHTLLVRPNPVLPHLPASVRGATAEQILEVIASTFRGVAVFGICSTSDAFTVQFVDVE